MFLTPEEAEEMVRTDILQAKGSIILMDKLLYPLRDMAKSIIPELNGVRTSMNIQVNTLSKHYSFMIVLQETDHILFCGKIPLSAFYSDGNRETAIRSIANDLAEKSDSIKTLIKEKSITKPVHASKGKKKPWWKLF